MWFFAFLKALFRGRRKSTICEAVRAKETDQVRTILEADPELIHYCKNQYGMTPLHIAANDGLEGLVDLLLSYNPDLDARDNDNATPLFLAAMGGHVAIMEVLIAAGARVNAQADEQVTPLHAAALGGHTQAVDLLLTHGANPCAEDESGMTPGDLVDDQALPELAERLLQLASQT